MVRSGPGKKMAHKSGQVKSFSSIRSISGHCRKNNSNATNADSIFFANPT